MRGGLLTNSQSSVHEVGSGWLERDFIGEDTVGASHGEKNSGKRGTERGYFRRGTACKGMEAVWAP